MQMLVLAVLAALTSRQVPHAEGHGRLIEPPSRATMWRYGFDTPPDYNDHELYCGGLSRQWRKNGGKCGICGDPWDTPQPRPHEAGGKYGQGVIVRRYKKAATITVRIELTANHRGYFEFRVCPNNNPRQTGTQRCLDQYLLKKAKMGSSSSQQDEQSHVARYFPGLGNKVFEMRYMLPEGLTCSQCILQWRYIAGNNWGSCGNGTEAVGCGQQEEFRACADVAIVDSSGDADETPYEDGDNEIIPTHLKDKTTKEPIVTSEEEAEEEAEWWLLIAIVICAFIAVVGALALLYLYYYHAADTFKKWIASGQFSKKQPPPVPPPRVRKQMLYAGARDEV